MTTKPVYAIAVFNDSIKGTVKFSEDLTNNVGVIYLYREFCIIYDLLVGVFLLYSSYTYESKS